MRLPFEPDGAAAARQLAEQQFQQRALAHAVAADDAQHLAGRDLARHAAHHVDIAVAAGHGVEAQARAVVHFSEPT